MYTFIRWFDSSLPSLIELEPAAIGAVLLLDFLWALICYRAFGPRRRSKAGQVERIALERVIKGAQTAQVRPTHDVVQSPFADHIPGLQVQPGVVELL